VNIPIVRYGHGHASEYGFFATAGRDDGNREEARR
jgi:hypothetical protein